MNAGELLQKMGTDAKIWAEEFNKIIVDKGEQPYDPELLIGWFANAIMAGHDSAYQKVSKSIPTGERIGGVMDEKFYKLAHKLFQEMKWRMSQSDSQLTRGDILAILEIIIDSEFVKD